MLRSYPSSNLFTRSQRLPGSPGMTLSTGVFLVAVLGLAPLFGWAIAQQNLILIAVVAMVASVPILIRWPIVSTFGVYAFLIPLEAVTVLSKTGDITVVRLFGVLAGAVLLTAGIMERRLVRPPSAAIWWTLFLVWATLSVAWAIDSGAALQSLKRLLSLGFLYLVAVSMKPSRKEFYWVCVLAVAGGLFAVSMNYLFGADVEAVRRGLVVGDKTTNPNGFGTVLLLPAALAMAGVVGQRRLIGRLVALGTLGFLGTGIYFTISRAALLGLLVLISVFIYRIGVRWQVVVLVALLASLVATMPDAFFVRMGRVFTGEDTTGSGRTEIWKTGVAALDRFGVFGAGYGNYTATYRFSDVAIYGPLKGAHNTYLEVWVELGVVGLALMLAAVAGHFLAARGIRRVSQEGVVLSAIEAVCFSMLAGAFFGDRIAIKSFWLVWILLTWASRVAWRGQSSSGGLHINDH